MKMQRFINNYEGGMNKDTSSNSYPGSYYFDLENFRVITGGAEGTTNSLRNLKGTGASFTVPNSGTLLGETILGDYLIIFVTTAETDPDRIYRIPLLALKSANNLTLTNTYYWNAVDTNVDTLVYKADLNFSSSYPIRAVGNYESSSIQKVYWVDGNNPLRHLNTVNDTDINPLETLDPERLDLVPEVNYGVDGNDTFDLSLQQGGRLKAGRVQYAYQLYAVNGTETMFSPASKLINVTSSSMTPASSWLYSGSDPEEFTNKSIAVTLTLPTSVVDKFDRLRLVALDYEAYSTDPTIRIVTESAINNTEITFTDTGTSKGTITLEVFRFIQNEIVPKTISSYKNYLIAGNITQNYFDVDDVYSSYSADEFLDTRSYRFRKITDTEETNVYTQQPHYPGDSNPDTSLKYVACTASSWTIKLNTDIKDGLGVGDTWGGFNRVESSSGVGYLAVVISGGPGGSQIIHFSLDEESNSTFHDPAVGTDYIEITGSNYEGGYTPSPSFTDGTPVESNYSYYIKVFYWYTETYSGSTTYKCYVNRQDDNVLEVTSPDFDEPPETHDCVNTFNYISNDFRDEDEFIYQSDGTALGGSGKFIDFEFDHSKEVDLGDEVTDEDSSVFIRDSSPFNNYQDQDYVLNYTGYQRDEVYRWAVVFYDLQGRPSYAKWIADIRNPRIEEDNPFAGKLTGAILALKFTVKWASFPSAFLDQISGIQFVRANRTDFDKTIKASGIVTGVCIPSKENADGDFYSTNTLMSVDDYDVPQLNTNTWAQVNNEGASNVLVDFISPEVAFNKGISLNTNDSEMQLWGYGKWGRDNDKEFHYTATNEGAGSQQYTGTNKSNISVLRRTIFDYFISLPTEQTAPVSLVNEVGGGTLSYKNRIHNTETNAVDCVRTYKGTSLVARLTNSFDSLTTISDGAQNNMLLAYCRTDLGNTIYGGDTYNARTYTEYIPASKFIIKKTSNTNYTVYGGDTYLSMFTFLRAGWDKNILGGSAPLDGMYETYYTFPVESSFNLSCRSDIIEQYMNLVAEGENPVPSDDYYYKLAEFASTGIGMFPNDYPDDLGNLYTYNSAYSASDKSKTFFSEPFDYVNPEVFIGRITTSDKKIPNEYSDSWTKFRFNNYIDLDGEQGDLTRIIVQNNKLMGVQKRGVAVLPIEEREVIQSQNTSELVVGTGGILKRYDYLSKSVGSTLHDAILSTENGIYLYDDNNMIIYRLGKGLEPLSDTKGIKSLMNDKSPSELILGYDRSNREVLCSSNSFQKTLVFNGYKNIFTGFYTFADNSNNYPTKYISFDKYLLSTTDDNKYYLHNVGDYGLFYNSTTPDPSTITYIINPDNSQNVSSFHTMEWLTDVFNGSTEIMRTFDTLQVYNTYQDTGALPLTYFSEGELSGTHDGGSTNILGDTSQNWESDSLAGYILKNYTKGTQDTIWNNDSDSIHLEAGTTMTFENGDMYGIYPDLILSRRFKKWRYNVLRDSGDSGRIRDSYVKAKFTYNNTNNYEFSAYNLITNWLPTKI